jgi:hypothetical protein
MTEQTIEENAEFGLVERFWIDDGELDGLSCQEIFVLGFEFCTLLDKFLQLMPFEMQFHQNNVGRVERVLLKHNIFYEIVDEDNEWPVLKVMNIAEVHDDRT